MERRFRMKRIATVLGVLVVLSTVPGWAGGITLMATYWDSDQAGDSSLLGVKIDMEASPHLDIELRASALGEDFGTEGQGTPFQLEAAPLELGFAYVFNREATVTGFLGAGLGFYLLEVERPEPDRLATVDDEAGWYLAGGFELGFHQNGAVLLEVMWRTVEAELDGDGLDDFDTLGVDLTGPAVNFGIQYRW